MQPHRPTHWKRHEEDNAAALANFAVSICNVLQTSRWNSAGAHPCRLYVVDTAPLSLTAATTIMRCWAAVFI